MGTLMLPQTFDDMFDNMFANIDAMFNYNRTSQLSSLSNRGLKSIIHRPHNLITNRDKDGNLTGYTVEVVYTPFTKSDVNVEVLDNNLTVTCGKENKTKDENMNYCGISYQSYSFTIPLAENIDIPAINAKADDGMLRIDLPIKKVEDKKAEPFKIEVL